MKLLVLNIDVITEETVEGEVVETATPTKLIDLGRAWSEEELDDQKAFLVIQDSEDIPANYSDISSIENWNLYGKTLIGTATGFKDWKCLRREIKPLIYSKCNASTDSELNTNWNSLNSEEKKVACAYIPNKVSYTHKLTTIGTEENVDKLGIQFDLNSMKSREQRYLIARTYLIKKIGKAAAIEFSTDCTIPDKDIRKSNYVSSFLGGVERKASDGSLGLMDLIDGAEAVHDSNAVDQLKALKFRDYQIVDGSGETIAHVVTGLEYILILGMY